MPKEKPLVIDDRLAKAVRPLKDSEFNELKEAIADHGHVEPVKFWNHDGTHVVVDGHHRVAICEELGIDPPREEIKSIQTFEDALDFVYTSQLARRSVDSIQRRAIQRAREDLRGGNGKPRAGRPRRGEERKTRRDLAEELGMSEEQHRRLDRTLDNLTAKQREKVASGELSREEALKLATKRAAKKKKKKPRELRPVPKTWETKVTGALLALAAAKAEGIDAESLGAKVLPLDIGLEKVKAAASFTGKISRAFKARFEE